MTIASNLFDIDELMEDYTNGFVRETVHPTDNSLHILCYTQSAQFERHWTRVTRNCRGLCLEYVGSLNDGTATHENVASARVISRGIPKFFTVDAISDSNIGGNLVISLEDDDENIKESETETVRGQAPAFVADKMDGAMCVGYIHDGLLSFHTKGSFVSDEANIANQIAETSYNPVDMAEWLTEHRPNTTPVFEVITPRFPHLIDYKGTEDIFYLGYVENDNGTWHPADVDDSFAVEFGLNIPEILDARTFSDAINLEPRPNREGVVITTWQDDGTQRMFKVKYDAFLQLRKMRDISSALSRDVLPRLILRHVTDRDAFDSLSIDEIADIMGIPYELIEQIDYDGLRRILTMSAEPLLLTAKSCIDEYDRLEKLALEIYNEAGGEDSTNTSIVFTVLNKKFTGENDKNIMFACKRHFLLHDETAWKTVIAKSVAKNSIRD